MTNIDVARLNWFLDKLTKENDELKKDLCTLDVIISQWKQYREFFTEKDICEYTRDLPLTLGMLSNRIQNMQKDMEIKINHYEFYKILDKYNLLEKKEEGNEEQEKIIL